MPNAADACCSILDQASDGHLVFERGECVYASHPYRRIVEYDAEEPLDRRATALKALLHPEDKERVLKYFADAVDRREAFIRYSFRGLTKSGAYMWREDSARLLYDESGNHVKTVVVARTLEDSPREEDRSGEATESRETIREINHRVKNDLGLVRAFLAWQARSTEDSRAKRAIESAAERVAAVGTVYEILEESRYRTAIRAGELLARLLTGLQRKLTGSSISVAAELEEDFVLPIKLAQVFSIVLNELTTNAVKYAFSATDDGEIDVDLARDRSSGQVIMRVRDNGKGFPEEVLQGSHGGFGYRVVEALVEQVEGTLSIRNEEGGVVELLVPYTGSDSP